MQFYWVNLGSTKNEVVEGGFLWAPISTRNGYGGEFYPEHWTNVSRVRDGDIVFCYFDGCIRYIATAKGNAYLCQRPINRAFKEWGENGYRVDVLLEKLESPIQRIEVAKSLATRFSQEIRPSLFTKDFSVAQIYMASLPKAAGLFLLDTFCGLVDLQNWLVNSTAEIEKLNKTTRDSLIKARVGQGKFRQDLLDAWGSTCSVTSVKNKDFLVASHIVPWSLSNNKARLDVNNGLLLVAHLDKLFDSGYISFSDDGEILLSPLLSDVDVSVFGLNSSMALRKINPEMKKYLAEHRKIFNFS